VAADTFVISIGLAAYLMLLATVLHPAIAAILAIILNADMFYEGFVWARSAIHAGNHSAGARVLEHFFHFLYLIAPILHPFSRNTANIYVSLRVMHGEWKSIRWGTPWVYLCFVASLPYPLSSVRDTFSSGHNRHCVENSERAMTLRD
jgi:hypothetical protein